MHEMIRFYAECRDGQILGTTALQLADRLEYVFNLLEREYGVKMNEFDICGLDGTVLQRWINGVKKTRKPATVNYYITIMNPFLRWAANMTHGDTPYIARDLSNVLHTVPLRNDDDDAENEEFDQSKSRYYSQEQVDSLLNYKTGRNNGRNVVRDAAISALILGSGLRVSEICSLTIGSILDHPRGKVYVRRKGGKFKYTDVADFVYPYIDKYLATRADIEDHNAPLFVTTHGNPCDRFSVYHSLQCKQKSLNMATGVHTLRHTFVSAAEKVGGGAVARDLANHKSLVITNRYDHSSESERKAAINSLPWSNT